MPLSKVSLTPLRDLRVSTHHIPAFERFPNTSIQHKPLLIYRSAFSYQPSAATIENHLRSTGVVVPQWRYTMYNQSHFHSTTHEVLSVFQGRARLCFGAESNPDRLEPVVESGDVIVVPAGVSHRLLEDLDGNFGMVGSYPRGSSWDMCYGREGEEELVMNIKALAWFQRDPVYGDDGPCLQV